MDLRHFRPEAAEFAGTFALVLFGAGSVPLCMSLGLALPLAGAAFANGLVVGLCVHYLGRVSGAHFNPAVTVAFMAVGEFPTRRAPAYFVAQLSGAVLGALALLALLGPAGRGSATQIAAGVSLSIALAAEAGATFILMFVIMAAATDARMPNWSPGPGIGAAVALGVFLAGAFTGGSMNPARSLAPAVVFGALDSLWLYLAAPWVGAFLAAIVYRRIRGRAPRRDWPMGEVVRLGRAR